LGGFRSQGAGTVDVIGDGQVRITLLVVPPSTPAAAAHVMSMAAASRNNAERVGDLLTRTGVHPDSAVPQPRGATDID
jgi:hypothetical protein